MAYNGFLLQIGDYVIPTSLIKADSYKPQISITDLDSYVDANGVLHRNALEHIAAKIEWETPAMMTDVSFGNLMRNIRSNFTVEGERKGVVTAYIPELDDYITQEMYMPDIVPNLYYADANKIQYDPIRLAFIGY